MNDFDPNSLEDLIAQIVARNVEYGFEMARDIGHKMPREYDVGFKRVLTLPHPNGATIHYRLRVNDATQDVVVLAPWLDGRVAMVDVARLWRDVMDRIESASLTMAHVWLDKHPEAFIAADVAKAAIGRLDILAKNDADQKRWAEEVRQRVNRARFETRSRR